jgi:hypothetical protein
MLAGWTLRTLLTLMLFALLQLTHTGSAYGQQERTASTPAIQSQAPQVDGATLAQDAEKAQDVGNDRDAPSKPVAQSESGRSDRPGETVKGDDGQPGEGDPEIQNEHLLYERLRRLHIPFVMAPPQETKFDLNLMRRPLLAFRIWANRPKPFIPSFLFCLIVSSAAWAFMSKPLTSAGSFCRKRFWRSLFLGVFATIFAVFLARLLFLTQIGTPLAICLAGALQLGLLLGLSVVSSLLGEAVLTKFGQSESLASSPRAKRLLELAIGALIFALLLRIPGVFGLPRIGVRVVLLICQLGLGGLIYTKKSGTTSGE